MKNNNFKKKDKCFNFQKLQNLTNISTVIQPIFVITQLYFEKKKMYRTLRIAEFEKRFAFISKCTNVSNQIIIYKYNFFLF